MRYGRCAVTRNSKLKLEFTLYLRNNNGHKEIMI